MSAHPPSPLHRGGALSAGGGDDEDDEDEGGERGSAVLQVLQIQSVVQGHEV